MQLNQRDVQQKKTLQILVLEKYVDFLQEKMFNKRTGHWSSDEYIRSINNQPFSHDIPKISHVLMGFQGFHPTIPHFLKTAGGRAPCATWPGSDPSLEAIVHWWWFTIYGENDERMNMYNLWWKWWLYSVVLIVFVYIYIDTYVCVYLYIGWWWLMVKNGW